VNPNLRGFDLHRPSSKGTKLPLQVIKASINQYWVIIDIPPKNAMIALLSAEGGEILANLPAVTNHHYVPSSPQTLDQDIPRVLFFNPFTVLIGRLTYL